jgi:hypothetical protein
MKNKTNNISKAIVLLSFCLLNTISFGQTKEETISWLKEKFEKCGYMARGGNMECEKLKYKINECSILVTAVITDSRDEIEYGVLSLEFPTTGCKIWGTGDLRDEFRNMHFGVLSYKSRVVKDEKIYTKKHKYWKNETILRDVSAFISNESRYGFYLQKNEDDILERIQKALDHLATFCPKKKETF